MYILIHINYFYYFTVYYRQLSKCSQSNSHKLNGSLETNVPSGHSRTSPVHGLGHGGNVHLAFGSLETNISPGHSKTSVGQAIGGGGHGKNSQSFFGSLETVVPSMQRKMSSVHRI